MSEVEKLYSLAEVEKILFLGYNAIDHDNTKSLIRATKPSCISSWLYKGLFI